MRRTIAATALAAMMSTPAVAEGQGKYSVSGTNIKDKSQYEGTATLTKTGQMTWRVVEDIAGESFEGFGIGDGKVIAVTFATDGSNAVALFIANPDGSYTGRWADEGDTDVSTETLKPE
jgi:hypothetical protein